jgi:MSHA biogenesis protein MshQ
VAGCIFSALLFWTFFGMQSAHATTSYVESTPAFNWISTSGQTLIVTGASGGTWSSGANCTTSSNGPFDGSAPDDDITWPIPLGFTFNFGGVNYTSVQIMANGRLEFGSNNQCGYGGPFVQIPTTTGNTVSTVTSIIPYSMDFDPDPVDSGGGTTCTNPTCGVYYGTGTASNGLSYFVVTWLANPGYAAQTPTYTVQAILYSDGSFEFQYENNTSDPPADFNGNLPAIGWEIDTSHYYQHPYSSLSSLNNTAILYSPSLLDHFVITVPSSGSCSALPISITAADASGNAITTFTDTITVSDVGSSGNNLGQFTAGSPTPYGTLTGSGGSPVTYAYNANDLGTVALNFLDNSGETSATIWVTDNTTGVTSSSSTITYSGGNTFNITPLNPTVSPTYSAVAGMPYEFQIELDNSNCGVVTNYTGNNGGNKTLDVSITRDSSDPGGTAPTVIDAVGGNSASAALPNSPSTTPVTLYFGGRRRGNPPPGGTAYFYLNTTDVGKYTISFTDNSRSGSCRRTTCAGSSSTITVRPFGVVVTNIKNAGGTANPGATTATGSIFSGAGQNFSATVTGVQWQSGDDANNDGIPDDYTALASSPVTASYGWSTTLAPCPTSTQMGSTGPNCSYAPSSGVLGSITNGTLAQAGFSGGSGTDSTLQYSEVGSFMLSATATNFLNTSGVDVTGYSGAIGRFTPDHFVVNRTLACSTFDYSGQPLLSTTVTAVNAAGTAATTNYSASTGFAKTVTVGDATNGTANFTNNTFANFVSGAETLPSPSDVTYTFPAVETPPVTLTLRATDTDGVSSATSGSEPAVPVRSGRLRIAQANGPEFVNLAVPIYLESYQSIGGGDYGWVTTTDDTCTTPVTSDFSLGTFTGSLTAGNTVISSITNVSPGIYTLTIGKPGVTGSAILTGDLSTKTWLYSDWATQNVLTKPTALISFGIYTGNPHQIYIH